VEKERKGLTSSRESTGDAEKEGSNADEKKDGGGNGKG